MIINIKNDELIALNGAKSPDFPKYTSQLINWANQKPKVLVLKLSESFMIYFLSLRMRPMMSLFQNGKNGI